MVAKQRRHRATSGSCFCLQAHHQIQHSNAVRSTINKIAHKPERSCSRLPGVFSVDQLRILQQLDKLFQIAMRSEEHTSELQSQSNLVCRLLLEKKKIKKTKQK